MRVQGARRVESEAGPGSCLTRIYFLYPQFFPQMPPSISCPHSRDGHNPLDWYLLGFAYKCATSPSRLQDEDVRRSLIQGGLAILGLALRRALQGMEYQKVEAGCELHVLSTFPDSLLMKGAFVCERSVLVWGMHCGEAKDGTCHPPCSAWELDCCHMSRLRHG